MPYSNLKAELGRNDITIESIAECLKIHRNSVANKIKGKTKFSIEEAITIQEIFFPTLSIDYLFATDEDNTVSASHIGSF